MDGSQDNSPPNTVEEVQAALTESLGNIWADFVAHLPYLIAGLLTLVGVWIIAWVVESSVRRALRKRKMRRALKQLLERFAVIVVWVIGLVLTAMIIFPGLTPASALGGLGLLSVAVGLAFKDIFENFFAGILLLWRFPFEDGDYIKCTDFDGRVERVELRNTLIRRTTGELLVVPNATLFKNAVEIVTERPLRRIHITAGVAYGEDVATAAAVIEDAVRKCESVDRAHPVDVFAKEFNSSSIDFDVSWWTESGPREGRRSQGEVITAVKKALDEAGIEIPFPYRTLVFKDAVPIQSGPSAKS